MAEKNNYSPKEIARPCPNCGKPHWDSDLNHSSSIKTPYGGSTLFGVCAECARAHDLQDIDKWSVDGNKIAEEKSIGTKSDFDYICF